MVVSINGDTPIAGWYINFIMENPRIKWMITRGTPMSGNLHMRLKNHRTWGLNMGMGPATYYILLP
jgi:hypothetical protein